MPSSSKLSRQALLWLTTTLTLALLALSLAPSLASAVVHNYTVTGSVDFLAVPLDYSLIDSDPVSGGESFTLTFDFDDAAPQTSTNGTTVSAFDGAISNLNFVINNGLSLTATSANLVAASNGGNDQWSVTVFTGSPGYSSNIIDPLGVLNEITGEPEAFDLQGFNFDMFDFSGNAYSSTPPELLLASSAVFDTQFVELIWQGSGPEPVAVITTISSVSSSPNVSPAVPSFAPMSLSLLLVTLGGVCMLTLRGRGQA